MMHFPLASDSPLFQKKIRTFTKFLKVLPFPAKISDDLFFSHRPQIFNFPLFSLFQYISSLFRENYSFPLLLQIPPVLGKFTCFLHTLRVSPYLDHDAFMHHPMHVLDAPEVHEEEEE